ncbi:MAG: 2-amino-4-hydroxy-6-hydroxymethyldihydropteridine diphosphokinase [bacterium]|nr:2-amino-4-hydroxy-6-hydroxymethyldihydropteridine diphosphokinase [bacterium]
MRYLIGIGSSHPQAVTYIAKVIKLIKEADSIILRGTSSLHPNPAFGGNTTYGFVNAAIAIEVKVPVDGLWFMLRDFEQKLGRLRLNRNGPRTMDLDVLWCCDGNRSTQYVTLPHPGLFERPSALIPAKEAAALAGWIFPFPI